MEGGFHPEHSLLWAQVRKASPDHGHDPDGDVLRPARHPACVRKVMIGNVTEALIGVFGAHQSPTLIVPPKFDEQQWVLEVRDSELRAEIHSKPYWGWGLFTKCFLNQIILVGPLERRQRLIYDLVAALGRPPWESVWKGRFAKATGMSCKQHIAAWEAHTVAAGDALNESIEQSQNHLADSRKRLSRLDRGEHSEFDFAAAEVGLKEADEDIVIAQRALLDRNSLAVERALDRVELALIGANPATSWDERVFTEPDLAPSLEQAILAEDLFIDEVVIPTPLGGREKRHGDGEDDDEIIDLTGDEDEVEADWLLGEGPDDEDEIPLIDLAQGDEEE